MKILQQKRLKMKILSQKCLKMTIENEIFNS